MGDKPYIDAVIAALVACIDKEHAAGQAETFIATLKTLGWQIVQRSRPCAATISTDPPQDCGWPECGCDPMTEMILAGLDESGFAIIPKREIENVLKMHSAGFMLAGENLEALRRAIK